MPGFIERPATNADAIAPDSVEGSGVDQAIGAELMIRTVVVFMLFILLASTLPTAAAEVEPPELPDGLSATDWQSIRAVHSKNRLPLHFAAARTNEDGGRGGDGNLTGAVQLAQQAYLKASSTGGSDGFGTSIAMSGDTVVVGSPSEDSAATGINGDDGDNSASAAGAVYVFARNGATWSQQAYLKASNTDGGDFFGVSVAVSGDTIVVGARLEDSTATGVNGDEGDNAAPGSGAAYVFVRNGETWTQQAYLKASNPDGGDEFGSSVAISGDVVIVGAPKEDSNATGVAGDESNNLAGNSGAAYVFVRDGVTWSQQAYLKASNTDNGDDFGVSLAVSGATVVVGARFEDSNATGVDGDETSNSGSDSGAAYVFVREDATWSQQAYLKASNTGNGDWFGFSVAVFGDTVVVGSFEEDSSATGVNGDEDSNDAVSAGAAYVFARSGITWSQQAYLKASNSAAIDQFGYTVAVADDTVVVGARLEDSNATGVNGNDDGNSALDSGAAYVFARDDTGDWSQQFYLKASNTDSGDLFGASIAVSGRSVVVGAIQEDSAAGGVDGDESDNTGVNSGAAYVFAPSDSLFQDRFENQ